MKTIDIITFEVELVRERSISPIAEPIGLAKNKMELKVEGVIGCIVWDWETKDEDGEEIIGLWFEDDGKTLRDYDGVFSLPKEAIQLLEKNGYNADYAKD